MIDSIQLHQGDCRDVLKTLADNSVDSIVTDPPYELNFMGRKWDNTGIAYSMELWSECLRVLKPGGYLLAFSATRTYHRMTVAIEDAGFEVRDMLAWITGCGFPKSLNVSKAIDKAAGAKREVIGTKLGMPGMARDGSNQRNFSDAFGGDRNTTLSTDITAPATDAAKQWDGWGTALKPAHEPVCCARKPLSESTVAANVLKHGTGAINIDGCRVGTSGGGTNCNRRDLNGKCLGHPHRSGTAFGITYHADAVSNPQTGRFPANVIHDGSEEVLDAFAKFGESKSPPVGAIAVAGWRKGAYVGGENAGYEHTNGYGDEGTAARFFQSCPDEFHDTPKRFFYSGKANKRDRAGSKHPTVKPVSLMRYLVRLVTPPGGTVLDPFAGSGTTGQAAREEGFNAILIERETEYCDDIRRRLRSDFDLLNSHVED
jgi:site-specific DNA-methyltransferase (adenine-specific)